MLCKSFRWVKLSGTDLLPGDVVSIGRSTNPNGEDKSVPADMLILAGSAIVNEAILTGESTPQWKVFIFCQLGICSNILIELSCRMEKGRFLYHTMLFLITSILSKRDT